MSITPFDGDGRLDEPALARHVSRIADAGVAVYLGSFGTGEGHLLEPDEILRLYTVGVEAASGRVPVYAAALGFQATDTVIALATAAADTGVSAVQIHPPRPGDRGARPTLAELDRYYADVLGAVASPVMLTNQVAMTGNRLPAEYIGDLVGDHPQVVGVNHTDPDPSLLAPVVTAVAGRAALSVGMVAQVPLLLALAPATGGALCFEPNVAPALCLAAITALRDGDEDAIARSYGRWRQLHEALLRYQNPRSVKAAMDILGLAGGPVREPILRLSAEEVAALAASLADLDLDAPV
jgi:dihydrodipicolinate synthase/N-acetylneuraminate lyase